MSKKAYAKGGKIGGSHGTMIPSAKPLVNCAQADPHVSKIVLGIITADANCKGPRLKLRLDASSIVATVNGHGPLQTIRVQSDNPSTTAAALTAAFREAFPEAHIVNSI